MDAMYNDLPEDRDAAGQEIALTTIDEIQTELATVRFNPDWMIAALTQGGAIKPAFVQAYTNLMEGTIPPSALKSREGAGGTKIVYIDHGWITRQLNAAFSNLWSFEVLEIHISSHDGSVATRCQLTLQVPIGLRRSGEVIWQTRRITEIGSFEGYPRSKKVRDESITDRAVYTDVLMTNWDGSPVYTMNEADRVASSASRGLVKCVLRAFNLGLDLGKTDQMNEETWTPKMAYNSLMRTGLRLGLSEDEIRSAIQPYRPSRQDREFLDHYSEMYRAVYNAAREKTLAPLPK